MKKTLRILILLLSIFAIFKTTKNVEAYEIEEYTTDITMDAEFRAAWISYYTGDINFTTIDDYKRKIDKILDVLEYYNLNAMIFHVRANHDAWYNSKINRRQSQLIGLNFDEFDPLEYVITEAHKRGIEFHAWLNPYRIGSTYNSKEDVAEAFKNYPNNPASNPDNVLIGSTLQILDPGIPKNRDFIVETCMEIVENYDVDAIHFDDYFYAAGINDAETVKKYNTDGLSTSNFRRQQVDTFIYDLKCSLDEYNQTNNKFVQLGISPTGVYKNANNITEATTPLSEYKYDENGNLVYPIGATVGCQMHYESYLYCDTLKWVNNEWINYILPQTYWARSHKSAPFERLINWWNMAVKNKNVNLYAGMGIYMWTSTASEAYEQLRITDSLENVLGTSIYSYKQVQEGFNNTNSNAKAQMNLVKTNMWNSKVVAPIVSGFEEQELGSVDNFIQYQNTICFSALENAKFYIIYRSENEITFDQSEIVDIIGSTEDYITWSDVQTGNYNYNVIPLSYTNNLGKPAEFAKEYVKGNIKYELYDNNSFTNKYNETEVLNIKKDQEVYIKITDTNVSNNLSDYYWLVDNKDVLTVNANGLINITNLGTSVIEGILKTDETKIIKLTINVYENDVNENSYKVTFKDYDGKVLKEETVKYGQSATPPANPSRESNENISYEFVGWNLPYYNITSDLELTAVYSAILKSFTVTFKNPNEEVLKVEKVPFGFAATEPEKPTMAPSVEYTYVFKEWDKDFSNITSDLVVYAVYDKIENLYDIDFNTNGGSKISSEFYFYNEQVKAPKSPTKAGYKFAGWYFDEELTQKCVFPFYPTKSITLHAKWDKIITIEFYDQNNNSLYKLEHVSGEKLTEIPTIELDKDIFNGWSIDKETEYNFDTPIVDDIKFYPLITKVYTVTFKDYDGTVLKEEVVAYGTDATAPTVEPREGYTFIGWDKEYTKVLSDLELNAQYELITYTITFDSNGGNDLENIEFTIENKNIELPTPTREGYTFLGWYEEEAKVETVENRNYELTAKWEEIVYIVTFKDYDGTVLKEEVVSYGTDATAPTVEPREGYTFKGWDKEYTKVLSDLELNAQYELIIYTITFNSNGGNEIEDIEFTIETKNIELPTPTREGYIFLGWYEEETKVETIENRNYELTAKWEEIIYKVTFYDQKGNVLKTIDVKENEIIKDIPNYKLDGFEFKGWSKDSKNKFDFNTKVSSDLELHPLLQEMNITKEKNCRRCNAAISLVYISIFTSFALLLLKKRK